MVTLSNMTGISEISVIRNNDGTVSIFVNYDIDIHNMNITVELDPKLSGNSALSNYSTIRKTFLLIPTDNEAAILYNNDTYKMAKIISTLSSIVGGLSLFVFLLGIFAGKVIGIEMMAVIQIAYFSLLSLSSLNPCFRALSDMWFVNGFNYFYPLSSTHPKNYLLDPLTPLPAKALKLFSVFTRNYNFTLLLVICPYLISVICLILSKTVFKSDEKKKLNAIRWAKKFACEIAFNGIMFSGYIIAVSFGL